MDSAGCDETRERRIVAAGAALSRGRALRARGEVNREGALHDHGEASRDKRVKYVHEGALHIQLLKSGMRGGGDECDIPCMHVDW